MSAETDEILRIFGEMLAGPTGDGKTKRDAGTKIHWTIDPEHKDAMLRHLGRWWNGEQVDADSGCHPLVHLAWRALAVAWQEQHAGQIPGQAQFWQEVQDGALTPATKIEQIVPRQSGFINHDPRPLPRTVDRAPCATKLYGHIPATKESRTTAIDASYEPFDEHRAYVEAAWHNRDCGEVGGGWPHPASAHDEGGLKGHHPC